MTQIHVLTFSYQRYRFHIHCPASGRRECRAHLLLPARDLRTVRGGPEALGRGPAAPVGAGIVSAPALPRPSHVRGRACLHGCRARDASVLGLGVADVASLDRRRELAAGQPQRCRTGVEPRCSVLAELSSCCHVCYFELYLGIHTLLLALFSISYVHPGFHSLLGVHWTHEKGIAVR